MTTKYIRNRAEKFLIVQLAIVPGDGLAPSGGRTSADTGILIYITIMTSISTGICFQWRIGQQPLHNKWWHGSLTHIFDTRGGGCGIWGGRWRLVWGSSRTRFHRNSNSMANWIKRNPIVEYHKSTQLCMYHGRRQYSCRATSKLL